LLCFLLNDISVSTTTQRDGSYKNAVVSFQTKAIYYTQKVLSLTFL